MGLTYMGKPDTATKDIQNKAATERFVPQHPDGADKMDRHPFMHDPQ
jgi:hypothetical protein